MGGTLSGDKKAISQVPGEGWLLSNHQKSFIVQLEFISRHMDYLQSNKGYTFMPTQGCYKDKLPPLKRVNLWAITLNS